MTDNRKTFVKGFLAGMLTMLLLFGAAGTVLAIHLAREAGLQRERAEQARQEAEAAHAAMQRQQQLAVQAENKARQRAKEALDAVDAFRGAFPKAEGAGRGVGPTKKDE